MRHIRCRRDMDWTYALRKLLMPDEKAEKAAISLVRQATAREGRAAAKKKDGDSVQHKRAGSEKGWLSWLGIGPDSAVPDDQGEATPLQVRMSKEAKLERSAKDLATTSTGAHEKKQRSHKHGHEDRANARDFLSARLRFLRRHKTKSMPKAERCRAECTPFGGNTVAATVAAGGAGRRDGDWWQGSGALRGWACTAARPRTSSTSR